MKPAKSHESTPFAPFADDTNSSKNKKDSFWLAKGVLLVCKRSPFGEQKGYIWKAKGLLFFNVKCLMLNVRCYAIWKGTINFNKFIVKAISTLASLLLFQNCLLFCRIRRLSISNDAYKRAHQVFSSKH